MKRKSWQKVLLVLFVLGISQNLWASEPEPDPFQLNTLKALSNISEEKTKIRWSRRGTPAFLTGKFRVKVIGKTKARAALDFLHQYKRLFRLKNAYQEFKVNKVEKDNINFEHVRLAQYHQGVPVYGEDLIVHFNPEEKITAVNGNYLPAITISPIPTISADEAVEIAKQDMEIDRAAYRFQPQVKLEVYPFQGDYFLVWHPMLPVGGPDPGNWEYFIDAHSGKILDKFNSLKFQATTGSGSGVLGDTKSLNTYLDSGTYYLYDTTKPMHSGSGLCGDTGVIATYDLAGGSSYSCPNLLSNDDNNNWIDTADTSCGGWGGTDNQNAEVDGHFYAGVTYNYYNSTHSRNSYDGSGADINVVTHYDVCYNNAFWNGSEIVFGDGNGSTFAPLSGSLDIVAHELTHAVTDSTANLEYRFQSGALNESYSDVFGAMAEFYHESAGGDWLIGEDVYTPGTSGDALRDMADPTLGGFYVPCNPFAGGQPDHMDDYAIMDVLSDNGGVHVNSGIPNKVAYLIASAIGQGPTELIYYRALTLYLTITSVFVDARDATLQACSDLYGTADGKYAAIQAAFDAVGILGGATGTYYTESQITNEFIGAGTAQGWQGDEMIWSYTLPFSFPFFGNNYSSVSVSDNGFLTFDCHYMNWSYYNDDRQLTAIAMIAPLWDDLVTNGSAQAGEDIYIHQPTPDSICFRWVAETWGASAPVNVEVVLYQDGRIKFNYGSGNTTLSPTVGISGGNLVDYDLAIHNGQSILTNANTVLFCVGQGCGGGGSSGGSSSGGSSGEVGTADDDDDDGGGDGNNLCFIATAAYGTPMAKEVQILCRFRDTYLLPNSLGQKLVSLYYGLSPPIARYIRSNPYLRAAVRGILRPVVWLIQSSFVEDGPGEKNASNKQPQSR